MAVAKKLEYKLLFLWLNQTLNAGDAIANDIQYHQVCWFLAQTKAKIKASSGFLQMSIAIVLHLKRLKFGYNMLEKTDENYNNGTIL